ncbi:hypothetical protein O7623_27760 [Solwaraspora sp. WMMD791]|nr:hypothetical protein [Solwaraspora sp. WMMD791]WFE27011.1 hypothetical protein O7623_27760 [Solwaraspora sp. WMMD791]
MSITFQALIRAGLAPTGWCPLLTARPRVRRPALADGQFASGN